MPGINSNLNPIPDLVYGLQSGLQADRPVLPVGGAVY